MKNLKKLMAAILTVMVLASMTVPVYAAVENAEKGIKLQIIGLMAGNVNDLNLDQELNRIQGLTFAIRAPGRSRRRFPLSSTRLNRSGQCCRQGQDTKLGKRLCPKVCCLRGKA